MKGINIHKIDVDRTSESESPINFNFETLTKFNLEIWNNFQRPHLDLIKSGSQGSQT